MVGTSDDCCMYLGHDIVGERKYNANSFEYWIIDCTDPLMGVTKCGIITGFVVLVMGVCQALAGMQ